MVRTLQLVTSRRPFFEQQVEVLERNGVTCTVVPVPGGSRERSLAEYARFYARVLRAARGPDIDLVHANYGLTAPAALAQPVRPVVLSLWGSDLLGRYGTVSEQCARFADEVVVMSPEMAGALDRDSTVVPHGIDTDRFAPQPREEAVAAVGWDGDATHVLFPYDTGRTEKNYPRAERVVERAREAVEGPLELHAVSGVPHEEVPTYMNAADAMLLTSDREGSPNAVKEALSCNLPVVATPVGDVPDLLDGVDCSAVADTDAALAEALAEAIAPTTEPNGRERAREFGLERMGEDLLSVYERALDGEVSAA
ncbi:glycosyltransferase [Halosimplex pelagicum]|uniref:Glycosyltransferase n=1 Tax=Halosimplex pelagicum TaxID=869886 RepID=A0A7D5TTS1_9EURY|nr:glycosyltransferase [Halosimplex pelagicum]QLH82652.1 glycosyltransferase [Halosimplex pelagicum]